VASPPAELLAVNILTDRHDWMKITGYGVAGLAVVGFLIEYVRGWRSRDE
jgi:hypothetical protein